jgi:hypothetical protein
MSFYNDEFFALQSSGSYSSAKAIVPYIVSMYHPKSIADIGGGIGTWCKVFDEFQIEATCYDGEYAKPVCKNFYSCDLSQPLQINKRFDLVLCLEVAEHLPEDRANYFIKDLSNLSNIVIFSAAIKGQGGTNHINEQPHEYWHNLFAANGFKINTDLRDIVRTLQGVEWWYSQNIFTYEKVHR